MSAEPGAGITDVGVLTCDRVDALRGALESFGANARRHRVPCRLLVLDDSRATSVRARNRAVAAAAARASGVGVLYSGAEEKRRFVDVLASESGVDAASIEYALFDPLECGSSIGANRNALLLGCAGARFVSTDDDTLARLARPQVEASGVTPAVRGQDPSDFTFFERRSDVLAGVTEVDESVQRLHSAWLGQHVPGGRVVATLSGVFGDSGLYSGVNFLCTPSVRTREALASDEATYDRAVSSREVLRVASRPTLAGPMPLMGTSLGIDATTLVPPFMPVLRNEDGVFGALLYSCDPHARALHLPRAILHAAREGRVYAPNRIDAGGVSRFSCLVLSILAAERPPGHGADVATALRAIGRRFVRLAALPLADYADATGALLLRFVRGRLAAMDRLLEGWRDAPRWIHRDVRAHQAAAHRAAHDGTLYLPQDLYDGRDALRARDRSRVLLGELGKLLMAWPELFAAARRLRARGEGFMTRLGLEHASSLDATG